MPDESKNPLPKPEIEKAPPAEVLKVNFDMDDAADKLVGEDNPPIEVINPKKESKVEPKKEGETEEEPVVEEVKKEEVKKEKPSILKAPVTEKKVEVKANEKPAVGTKLITPKTKEQRDYTGFSNEEVTALKGMSNEGFALTSKLIKENKELVKNKDGSFLQHPEAYILSPEYKQTNAEIAFAQAEGQLWQRALIDCKAGKKFRYPAGVDKNGQILLSAETEPTDQYEEELRANANNCSNVQRQLEQKKSGLGSEFQKRSKTDLQMIQQERASRFAWVQNPEILEHTFSVPMPDGTIQDKSIKAIKEDFTSLFPPYLRNNPGVEVASDLMVALMIQSAELKEAQSQQSVAEVKNEELNRGEPSSNAREVEKSKEVNGVKSFSLAGMPDI